MSLADPEGVCRKGRHSRMRLVRRREITIKVCDCRPYLGKIERFDFKERVTEPGIRNVGSRIWRDFCFPTRRRNRGGVSKLLTLLLYTKHVIFVLFKNAYYLLCTNK